MAIQNKVRKGDVVAIKLATSHTYVIGSGRGTESRTFYTLARVEAATRDGAVKLLCRVNNCAKRSPYDLRAEVLTISAENQSAARSLFAHLCCEQDISSSEKWSVDEFANAEELKAAIVRHRGIPMRNMRDFDRL